MECQCLGADENKRMRSDGVEYLETPTKSESDKKEYRVLKLKNGLIATLISDPKVDDEQNDDSSDTKKDVKKPDSNEKTMNESSGEEEGDEEDEEDGESESGSEDGDDDDDDDDEDDEDGEDEEGAGRSSKRNEKLAACRLAITVGSYSDPDDIPGLAHFLEHMVFMGSEKYPEENDFSQFVSNRGGSDNAQTENERTVFYFDIQQEHFLPAMDRFAQFFVSPLLKRDSISREREAVDSEYLMARQSDCERKDQVFTSLAEKNTPISRFLWGNLKSLRDDVDEDKLYEELHKFRKRHYSAHRMTLAVQARLSLDELEKHVIECFSNIPTNCLPPDDFSSLQGKVFKNPEFRKIHKIKAIKDKCNVELAWILPPMHDKYKVKPWKFITQVLDSDKKGSLNYYLRKKLWCHTRDYTAWSNYQDDVLCGYNSIYALFRISLDLTDEGREHLSDVLDAVFSYLNLLRLEDPPKRILDEIKLTKELDFRFADEDDPCDNVEICDDMIYFPPKDYITGDRLYFEYDVELTKNYINMLLPEDVNIMILDPKLNENDLDKTEEWFEVKYSSEKIPDEWIARWKSIQPLAEFHLPKPNIFVPDDFTLVDLPEKISEYPEKVFQDDKIEIWHKISEKFRLPKCYIALYLISPVSIGPTETSALLDVFVGALKLLSIEESADADDAGLGFDFSVDRYGIAIDVYGFNQKLSLLLEILLKYVADCHKLMTKESFELVKEKKLKSYQQQFIKPSKLLSELHAKILTSQFWMATERHAALHEITYDQFLSFTNKFTENLYIKCLAEGNLSKEFVLKTVADVVKPLQYSRIPPEIYPHRMVWEIPVGRTFCQVKNLNPTDDNCTITHYYQCGYYTVKLKMMVELLMDIMNEPVFNQLRTIDQLGYAVSCYSLNTLNVIGFSIKVCPQATKFTAKQVDEKINNFLKDFVNTLKKMSKDVYNEHKQALIKSLQLTNLSLAEEFYKHWPEIKNHHYMFDRNNKNISAVTNLSQEDFLAFVEDYMVSEKKVKKMHLRVMGTADEKSVKKGEELKESEMKKYSITFLPVEEESLKQTNTFVIEDVKDYLKKNLMTAYDDLPQSVVDERLKTS